MEFQTKHFDRVRHSFTICNAIFVVVVCCWWWWWWLWLRLWQWSQYFRHIYSWTNPPPPVFSRPFTKNHAEYERITSDIIIKYSNWYLEFRAAPIHRCPAAGAGKPLSLMIFWTNSTDAFGTLVRFGSEKSTRCSPKVDPYPSVHSKLSITDQRVYPVTVQLSRRIAENIQIGIA